MNNLQLQALRAFAAGRPWTIDADGVKVEGVAVDDIQWLPFYLRAYAAQRRQQRVDAGMTVQLGDRLVPVWTDADSRAALIGAVLASQIVPEFATGWKGSDGVFYPLDAAELQALALAVLNHVNDAFAREATVVAGIENGGITSTEQIDVAFS